MSVNSHRRQGQDMPAESLQVVLTEESVTFIQIAIGLSMLVCIVK